jgi:hypothetical protein
VAEIGNSLQAAPSWKSTNLPSARHGTTLNAGTPYRPNANDRTALTGEEFLLAFATNDIS